MPSEQPVKFKTGEYRIPEGKYTSNSFGTIICSDIFHHLENSIGFYQRHWKELWIGT